MEEALCSGNAGLYTDTPSFHYICQKIRIQETENNAVCVWVSFKYMYTHIMMFCNRKKKGKELKYLTSSHVYSTKHKDHWVRDFFG